MKKRILTSLLSILILASAFAVAQSSTPVAVRLEIYIVSMIDGEEQFKEATEARPGQVVEYRLFAVNGGDTTLPGGAVQILGPVPDGTTYVSESATPTSEVVLTEYTEDGSNFTDSEQGLAYSAVRWTVLSDMEPNDEEAFVYRVTVNKN